MTNEYRTLSPLDDMSGKTADELRALAETYSAQAQDLVFKTFWPIANLALVVMELKRLAGQAGPSAPWWAALKAGEQIKIARAGVEVYYSDRVMVWRTVGLTWPVMVVAQPAQGDGGAAGAKLDEDRPHLPPPLPRPVLRGHRLISICSKPPIGCWAGGMSAGRSCRAMSPPFVLGGSPGEGDVRNSERLTQPSLRVGGAACRHLC